MVPRAIRFGIGGTAVIALAFLAPVVSATPGLRSGALAADVALSAHLNGVDEALQRQDAATASRELQAAYQAALASRRWHGLLAYGDAAVRVGDAAGERQHGVEQARRAYLMALYRARSEGSFDGALAAAQSFLKLGDRELAQACVAVAARLARSAADKTRAQALASGLEDRLAHVPTF